MRLINSARVLRDLRNKIVLKDNNNARTRTAVEEASQPDVLVAIVQNALAGG